MILHGHPFSSYTWKAQIALHEKSLPYTLCKVDDDAAANPDCGGRLPTIWPVGQFPVLEDGDNVLIESSIVIEYLDQHYPETARLIPADPAAALHIRFMDRLFDNHVMAWMQAAVAEHLPFIAATPDPVRIERARNKLTVIYRWLEDHMSQGGWACGTDFSLADCAGAPALFYADWVHPIPDDLVRLRAYRARCVARPSVAKCINAARPFRHYFPFDIAGRD